MSRAVKFKRNIWIFLVAGLSLLTAGRGKTFLPKGIDLAGSIEVDGYRRTYILHFPPTFNRNLFYPLVIALHGGGGSARAMIKLTEGKFNELADQEGFIVVYPNAIRRHWNDGRGLSYYSHRKNINDVKFISRLIDYLSSRFPIDRRRGLCYRNIQRSAYVLQARL